MLIMQNKLDTSSSWDIMELAIREGNVQVIQVISEKYPKIVSEALEMGMLDPDMVINSDSLFFQLSTSLSAKEKNQLLHILLPKILAKVNNLQQNLIRTYYPENQKYVPGRPWDLEQTLENYLQSNQRHINYDDIVIISKKRRKKQYLLLVDKSQSVIKYMRYIVFTAILLSKILEKENYSIYTFDNDTLPIKLPQQRITLETIIYKLINLRSGGKTNISRALSVAKKEFSTSYSTKKTLVLISDLLPTTGNFDFVDELKEFEEVKIILTPHRRSVQLVAPIINSLHTQKNIDLYEIPKNLDMLIKLLEKILFS